jgi:hypothetical protein
MVNEKSLLSTSISSPVAAVYFQFVLSIMILKTLYFSLLILFSMVTAVFIEITYSPVYPPAINAIFFLMYFYIN